MKGYAGRILRIDLSTGAVKTEPLPEEVARKYIGGIGLGMYLWVKNSEPGIDPFSPENPLICATGPLSGTFAPTGGNGHAFVAKSPESYAIGEAKAHGFFGAEMKRAGYDAIIIEGRAERPTYIWIDDDTVQLMNAEHLWGKTPVETEEAIRKELGDYYIRVACIGPAGERLVRVAGIMNDRSRWAGRCGLGAVMGSKNLKAIAVRGTKDVEVAHPEELEELVKVLK
ncbi:MAG TPA: aldehyde ferredoxin oxidoreductase, partial [Candidatus Bathyarchaeota archaeon]|nr:aldehyde ferredoxin oxidoreductase [Candidatus Bathyarchaeota archaeon]